MCPQRSEVDTSTVIAAVDTLGRRVAPRHYRSVEEKIQIVTESRMPGASVAEVARRHGVNANQVFTWRLQQEQGVLGRRRRGRPAAVKLLPVQVRSETQEPLALALAEASTAKLAAPASEGRIEITLADGIRIAISGAVPSEQLHRVLAVLR
jgi:transposase